LQKDGLVEWDDRGVRLTVQGRHFIRNVCSAFDLWLNRSVIRQQFSKAV